QTVTDRTAHLRSICSIGRHAAPFIITLIDLTNGNLTDEQAAALALAAAPGDVAIVGVDGLGHTVRFSFTSTPSIPSGVTLTGIEVKQLAPLFVGATGTFNATSTGGAVFVQSTQPDLNIGFVSAGTDASLTTAQDILSAGMAPTLQIHTGGNLVLLAGSGDIAATHSGSTHTPLRIEVIGTLTSATA